MDGSVFVKAADLSANPDTPDIMRREAGIAAALPTSVPAPRLYWTHDADGWVAMAFECVEGVQPQIPWHDDELRHVLGALQQLAISLTPSPIVAAPSVEDQYAHKFDGWRKLAAKPGDSLDAWSRHYRKRLAALEPGWVSATVGETLLHTDIRADNLLIDHAGKVWVVDWPHACRGVAWFDLICMAPSVALQGGPDPQTFIGMSGLTHGADTDAITASVVALAGYFSFQATLPDPPGLPTLRAFQRAQGEVARHWVARRIGWA